MKNSKTNMKWDSSELSFLKKHPHMSAARLAKKLKRTVKAVEMRRHKLKLAQRAAAEPVKAPATRKRRTGYSSRLWTLAHERTLKKLWADPSYSLVDIALELARTPMAVYHHSRLRELKQNRSAPTPDVRKRYDRQMNRLERRLAQLEQDEAQNELDQVQAQVIHWPTTGRYSGKPLNIPVGECVTPPEIFQYSGRRELTSSRKLGWLMRTLLGVKQVTLAA